MLKLSSFNKLLNIAIMISYLVRSSIMISIVNQIQAIIIGEANVN
jgi:hypothetical protein